MLTKNEFKKIFCDESKRLSGTKPDAKTIEEEYNGYVAGVRLFKSDGDLEFTLNEKGKVGYIFTPRNV